MIRVPLTQESLREFVRKYMVVWIATVVLGLTFMYGMYGGMYLFFGQGGKGVLGCIIMTLLFGKVVVNGTPYTMLPVRVINTLGPVLTISFFVFYWW